MQTLTEIRALLDEHGLAPRHRLGQNFLHDKNQLVRLVEAASIAEGDLILEVGPGTGTLTEALLDAGAEIVAVELDEGLADLIQDRLGERVTLIRGDALQKGRALNAEAQQTLGDRPFRLVANLPYQVATPLMAALLIDHPSCLGQHVTIQREVADRLVAQPRTKAYGPLSIIVRSLADVQRIAVLPPGCFWPQPKVDSAMVTITPRAEHGIDDPAGLARFATELFMARRKQLGTTFGRDQEWPDGVTDTMRPEELTVAQIIELRNAVRHEPRRHRDTETP